MTIDVRKGIAKAETSIAASPSLQIQEMYKVQAGVMATLQGEKKLHIPETEIRSETEKGVKTQLKKEHSTTELVTEELLLG